MKPLLYIHIVAGFIGLTLFWIPALSHKGGKLHRQVGKVYIWAMWVTVVSAFVLSVFNVMNQRVIIGIFLGFIALITGNPLWYGIGILRHKQGLSKRFLTYHMIFRGMIIACAIGMIAYGLFWVRSGAVILLYIFGALGLTDLPSWIRELRSGPSQRSWFREHLVAMFTSGIAAFTAFLVFGANNYMSDLLPGYWAVVPWILPTIVGTIAISRSIRHWQSQGAIKD